MMVLRPYQERAVGGLRAKIAAGKRRVVLVLPTGGGKTVVAAAMVLAAVARGKRVLFLAHRKELIDQTVAKLAAFGVACGVIMGNDPRRDDFHPVQVASVQTLSRRLDKRPPADLVMIDECHHATANTYREIADAYPTAVIIGLTATPWVKGLAELFDDLVVAATPAELMALGALVRYDASAYDAPELHDVKLVGGDFNQKQLGLACNTSVLVGKVVEQYLEHARGRRGILFPVDVAHSMALVGEFQSMGVAAEHLDCHTPKTDRERILAGLASGAITIVSSVGVLTEGFDCPAAEVCLLARPTQSLILHLQMIGRVLRPCPETGKAKALIHDHAGNLLRHGLPEEERTYVLAPAPKRDVLMHTCPFCCLVFGALLRDGTCPRCGQLVQRPEEPLEGGGGRAEKVVVEGRRLDLDEIRRMRAERGARVDLDDDQLAKVASATMEEKAAEHKRLLAVEVAKGYSHGWAAHRFRETFGVWPRFGEKYDNVQAAERPIVPLPPRKRSAA
jgi:DNA repair protein RadD